MFCVYFSGKRAGWGGWYLIKVRDFTVKKNSMKYFCITKEKNAYMERVIQISMFNSSYLFLFILLCNIDSTLVLDSNAYIWISNCIQMFEFIFECWRNVFLEHAIEKWRLQMIWNNIWKRQEISLLLLLSFFNPKMSLFFLVFVLSVT